MINKIVRKSVKKLSSMVARDLDFNRRVSTDVLLDSYPKSGNTWLRFLVANYLVSYFELPVQANWFTVQDLIPDLQAFKSLPKDNMVSRHYGSRILKSHECYSNLAKRVVLLTRRPEDALSSCYKYYKLNGLVEQNMSFDVFLHEHQMGIDGWNQHTLGWLKNYQIGSIVRFFRFEDLKNNTEETLSEIIDLLGLHIDKGIIKSAVIASSRESMARSENKHRSSVVLREQTEKFVGSGRIGRAREVASLEQIEEIRSKTKEAREILNYK